MASLSDSYIRDPTDKNIATAINDVLDYRKWKPSGDPIDSESSFHMVRNIKVEAYHLILSVFSLHNMKDNLRFTEKDVKEWVHVSESTIEGAGWGLFAAKGFNKNEIISVYIGFSIEDAKKSKSQYLLTRVFEDGNECVVDPRIKDKSKDGKRTRK